jgi:hypothetical protein
MGFFDIFRKKHVEDISGMNMDMGHNLDMDNLGTPQHPDFTDISTQGNPSLANQGYDMGQGAINLSTMNNMGGISSQMSNPGYNAQQPGSGLEKDIQIISLKLDAIKSEMDSMNQRIKNIEMIAEKEQQPTTPQKRWY